MNIFYALIVAGHIAGHYGPGQHTCACSYPHPHVVGQVAPVTVGKQSQFFLNFEKEKKK